MALSASAPLPGCGVDRAQHSSSVQVLSCFSGHPGVLCTPISGSPVPQSPLLPQGFCTRQVQGLPKVLFQLLSPTFPGPARPTRGLPTLQVQTDGHKKSSGLRGLARCSRRPHPIPRSPGARHTPILRCHSSPQGAEPGPSRASLGSPSPARAPPGRPASTRPRDSSGLARAAPPRGGGRGRGAA